MVLLMTNACTLCARNERFKTLEGSNKSDLHLWKAVEEEPVMHGSDKVLVPKCRSQPAFSSFMFPDHGMCMSFTAQGHKAHMVFAPLESPYSDKVVNGEQYAVESPHKRHT